MTANREAPDDFTDRILAAINTMLLDMLAAFAWTDYKDLHKRIRLLLNESKSVQVISGLWAVRPTLFSRSDQLCSVFLREIFGARRAIPLLRKRRSAV